MHRPDQNHQHEQSSTDLMTDLLLPVYLAAWTRAYVRSEQLRTGTTTGDEVDSDADDRGDDEADREDGALLIFLARTMSVWLRTCELERHDLGHSYAAWRCTTTSVKSDVGGTPVSDVVCSTSHS